MAIYYLLAPLTKINAAPFQRPVIPLTLAIIAGIVLGNHQPGYIAAAMAILLGTILRLAYCIQTDRPAWGAPLLAAAAAGYLSLMPWVAPRLGPAHVTHFLDGGRFQVRAIVIDAPVTRMGRTRFVVAVDRLSRGDADHRVNGRIRVTVMGEVAPKPGDRVLFTSRLRAFHNFRNPGGFDYRRYMAFRRIHGSAWVREDKLTVEPQSPSASLGHLIRHAHQRMGRIIDAIDIGQATDEKAVLKALVFGDRTGIDDDLRGRFNRAGVGHLLAISGLHVGIVAVLAYGVFKWMFSFPAFLLWRGWGRAWAAGATLVPVVAYGLISGMSPSTQRAVIMVAVFMLSMMLGRSRDTLNTLAVAALLILVVFPPTLFSISFQLSFAAVLAIVAGMERIAIQHNPSDGRGRKAAKRLMGGVMVSVMAIAGTAPLVLYHFNQTSLVGVAANLLLVPLIGFGVVPMGLASALSAFVFEPLSTMGFGLSLHLLHGALMIVDGFAGLPFAAFYSVTPSLLEVFLFYMAGWALLNLGRNKTARWILACVIITAAGDGLYWAHHRLWHRDFRVTAVDVGQGTATLMEFPGGHVVLMDGGGFSDNRVFDMGKRVLAPLLWRKKIASVDVLVLSHPNADHLNGLIYIARHFHVRELWTNGDAHTTWGYSELMRACREQGIGVRVMDAGQPEQTFGGVTLAVLHPAPDHGLAADADDQADRNNASLVLKATYGKIAFLLTGDIMAKAEKALVQRAGARLASTVLIAPHHGSRTSSSTDLITAVKPVLAVISAGVDNRFGFPHAEVIDRYRQHGCQIRCTCSHGAIFLSTDGENLHWD